MSRLCLNLMVFCLAARATAGAADQSQPPEKSPDAAEKFAFFEKSVRPLLVARCYDCHSGDSGESGLSVDSLAGLLKGGARGPAIVPGKPEQSLLVRAIRHGELLKMPAKQKLPAAEIAHLAKWVAMGAPWPNAKAPANPDSSAPATTTRAPTDEQRSYWAFQRPGSESPPKVNARRRLKSPIDAFIVSRLESRGLTLAEPADRRTLIRRATFDLTGLPPTPDEVDAFLADKSPQAFSRVVDRLLASPHYGERFARHWLDVARYGDSNGLDENLAHANAFRYRDYVVAAFNRDMPYDQFVREQIAGDLLPQVADPRRQANRIVATGFLCLGAKMLAEDDPVKLQMDIIDEQLDTIGRAFLGLTFGCARCHDHKFDPISMADYYALAGIFKSTKTMDSLSVVARWHERPLATPEGIAARKSHQGRIDAVASNIRDRREEAIAAISRQARQQLANYLLTAAAKIHERNLLVGTQPVVEQPQSKQSPDVVQIQAEAFARGNVLKDTTGYGKGIGVLVNAGKTPNFVEYDVELPHDGLYQLDVRYAAAGSRPCLLSINGQRVKSDLAAGVTGSWFPDSQRWEVAGLFRCRAGKNVIRLEHPQYFPHIDQLLLAPSAAAGTWTKALRLEARFQPVAGFVDGWIAQLDKALADKAPADKAPREAREPTSSRSLLRQFAKLALAPPADSDAKDAANKLRQLAARLQKFAIAESDEPAGLEFRKLVQSADGPFAPPADIESHFPPGVVAELAKLRAEEMRLKGSLPILPEAMAVAEAGAEDTRIHYRGSHLTLGPAVPRRFPLVLTNEPASIPIGQSGRLQLARWLTSPEHPLTARVLVNRVWQWHFGAGLVRSPDNFGRLGQRPTHPELLDWLAVRFMDSGWRIKELHRLILLSSTWQQSTRNEAARAADVENELWGRMNRRRLDVESIRDGILAAAGNLDRTMGGSLLRTANRKYVTSTANVDPVIYATNRRSIYLPVVRSALYDVFAAFDFAEPSVSSGQRQTTTVAPQALFMMNSELVADQTRRLAEHLLADAAYPDDESRVNRLWRLAYGRPASHSEQTAAADFIADYGQTWKASRPDQAGEARLRSWQGLCRAVFGSNEFIYLD